MTTMVSSKLLAGLKDAPRVRIGGRICHELINCAITLGHEITYPSPVIDLGYFVAQLAWYLRAQPGAINGIDYYHTSWSRITWHDSKPDINSNYGVYVFGEKQLYMAIERLKKEAHSRQALVLFNRPDVLTSDTHDHICTTSLQLLIRDWRLHAICTMRSNDFYIGYTYDVLFFRCLQLMALRLLQPIYPGLELGSYHHNVGSMHIYHDDLGRYDGVNVEDMPLFAKHGMPIIDEMRHIHSNLGPVEESLRLKPASKRKAVAKQATVADLHTWNYFLEVLVTTLNNIDKSGPLT
jgi:hypothetical protein